MRIYEARLSVLAHAHFYMQKGSAEMRFVFFLYVKRARAFVLFVNSKDLLFAIEGDVFQTGLFELHFFSIV